MKVFKLIVHQKNFSVEDLIINPKDHPGVKEGDIVEIYHPEDDYSRLLLQVTSLKEDFQTRETISVEQTIANQFQLRTYADVYMNKVNPDTVSLDSIELTFKEQYMGRSEMFRIKKFLVGKCVYLNKKLEFCCGSFRCQVYEMWSQGDRVACGVITEDTKIVFRSNTSMVYLFLQMSSEMWDFDIHGDLYFEKAVNGFLADLFQKWKKNGSFPEVTIVLFSRTFYEANNLDEFPEYMRDCLQQDYKGRFYEDFYRVAVQNEKYDDWTNTLVLLRRMFTDYQTQVVEYHKRDGVNIPRAVNATAAQGNFLEVLNMSLNVFEKHYLDRSFDRTGQLSVVITPGVGVFEVDRELTNVTKQRIIDNGVGSDLVCVGEQPLHAVPLLKFHNKDKTTNAVDDYSMPHWINLSFYSTNKKVAYSTFIPRIKLPPKKSKPIKAKIQEEEMLINSVFDYDAYDAQVFQLPPAYSTRLSRSDLLSTSKLMNKKLSITLEGPDQKKYHLRKLSDPHIHVAFNEIDSPVNGSCHSPSFSIPIGSPSQTSIKNLRSQISQDLAIPDVDRPIIGSYGSSITHTLSHSGNIRPGRALINPFDPSHVTIKLTSNRRRWTHIFPKGPTGVLIQQHHYQAVPAQSNNDIITHDGGSYLSSSPTEMIRASSLMNLDHSRRYKPVNVGVSKTNKTLLWGATGEQEWTPALTTGVDWKSLTIPACLPITTDYIPDKRSLQNDYVLSNYDLLPDLVNSEYAQRRAVYKKPLSTEEVFNELISQRLAQGFQLVIQPSTTKVINTTSSMVLSQVSSKEQTKEYILSIGRIFHKITLSGSTITVTRYRPRHPYPPFKIHYRYRFQAPDHSTYEMSWVSFTTEKLENYPWSHLDLYICTRGDTDYPLDENSKFWRFRVYLLPLNWNSGVTKKIMEGAEHCDLYQTSTLSEQVTQLDSFLRYIELYINKVKKPNIIKKQRSPQLGASRRRHSTGFIPRSTNLQGNVGNSPFRDRLGSTRLPEKPRPRSGSKVLEKGRISPAIENLTSVDSTSDHDNGDDSSLDAKLLSASSSMADILEAMKHPNNGVGFFTHHDSLPSYTFTSGDAVQWLISHLDGVNDGEDALLLMQNMLNEKLICHASGDFSHAFIIGFYLYFIVIAEKDRDNDHIPPLNDLRSFKNEWLEVEVMHPLNWKKTIDSPKTPTVPRFLAETIDDTCQDQDQPSKKWKVPMYKQVHLEIDINKKSDRVEWGHCRYQSCFKPDRAFELVIQWVAASGTIVADLITGWARKAQSCGIFMIPLPGDPLALPFTDKSDPLRGPIFVPLDTESLMGKKSYLFEDFPESTWDYRLMLFQEAIVQRFGFIACAVEGKAARPGSPEEQQLKQHHHHQYVHLTGNIFILIPSSTCSKAQYTSQNLDNNRHTTQAEFVASPHVEYITRHVSGNNRDHYGTDTRPGFLWFWNHMVSRRWKPSAASATGDEPFQNKILKDFREFCSNQDNRLLSFWHSSYSLANR